MFRNLRKKTKKFEVEIYVKNKFFSKCQNFFFALYILISPNLHIILKKNCISRWISKRRSSPKKEKNLAVNPRNGTLTETQKPPYVL